jgi:hypothetical protein
MPISGASSYVPTTQAFLSHWGEVNTALGAQPFTLAGSLVGQAQPVTVAQLTGLYMQLVGIRSGVSSVLVEEEFARADLAVLKARLVQRIGEVRDFVAGNLPGSRFERALPPLPDMDSAQGILSDAAGRLRAVWTALNASTGLGLTLPLVLQGGYAEAQFATDMDALAPAYLLLAGKVATTRLVRESRNDLQDKIYPVLKAYRQVMPTMFPAGHALTDSLPALTPTTGATPAAVTAHGAWDAAASKAKVTWSASTDAALDHYEVRGVPGNAYTADDESVLATVDKAAAREFETEFALGTPGVVAGFKVYVVLTTGNEKGSDAVYITRPA